MYVENPSQYLITLEYWEAQQKEKKWAENSINCIVGVRVKS